MAKGPKRTADMGWLTYLNPLSQPKWIQAQIAGQTILVHTHNWDSAEPVCLDAGDTDA